MTTSDQLNDDSYLSYDLRNIKLDTSTNCNSNIQSEKANSSLSKIDKHINEKYDKSVLKHLK